MGLECKIEVWARDSSLGMISSQMFPKSIGEMRRENKVRSEGLGLEITHGNALSAMFGTEEALNKCKLLL